MNSSSTSFVILSRVTYMEAQMRKMTFSFFGCRGGSIYNTMLFIAEFDSIYAMLFVVEVGLLYTMLFIVEFGFDLLAAMASSILRWLDGWMVESIHSVIMLVSMLEIDEV